MASATNAAVLYLDHFSITIIEISFDLQLSIEERHGETEETIMG
jgi:hypothetical protein